MLRGRFGNTSGQPFIEGRIFFPRLRIAGDVSFLLDTGADNAVLMPTDADRLLIQYTSLVDTTVSIGVSGLATSFVEPAVVAFLEPKGPWVGYRVIVQIAEPDPGLAQAPSLLGRDILNRWRIVYNPRKNELLCQVIDFDESVPL